MQGQQRVVRKRKGTTARSIQRWLRRNGYNYTDVRKGIYIDGHERKDVVTYREEFVKALEDLWPFVVEFEDDGSMREKEYPPGCTVGGGIENRSLSSRMMNQRFQQTTHDSKHG